MAETQGTLRRAGLIAAIVAVVGCFGAGSAAAAPLVLAGNYDGESVSVINTQTNMPVGEPIELGSPAGAIAIVPGGAAYVAEPENDSVTAIDPQTSKVLKTIPVGELPESLAVSPDGKTLYVADVESEEVAVIDTATNTSSGSIPLTGDPFAIAFAPNGKLAYVSVGDNLVTIDPAREQLVGERIPIGEVPRAIAFSPDGKTAYVSEEGSAAVGVVSTALGEEVDSIPMPGANPKGIAVSPDGSRLYVTDDVKEGTVSLFSTATNERLGEPIKVGEQPYELAFTPSGRTLYVADYESTDVTPIDTSTRETLTPIEMPGLGPWQLAITPDLSPTAAFSVLGVTTGLTATFDGSASTDPDGTVSSYYWAFGDGSAGAEVSAPGLTALGPRATHTYGGPGTYPAALTVLDNEGCGVAQVFTGRTAYCSGNPSATVSHPVAVTAPPVPIVCSARFSIGGVSHNRKNGTVRLRLRFPTTGWFLLLGKKVHAVTRKVRKPGTTVVTLHPRVELAKRLKKTLHAQVKFRITFAPTAVGCGARRTVHRSLALQRAPLRRHDRR
jgi:YVTN family beta-propeller protein